MSTTETSTTKNGSATEEQKVDEQGNTTEKDGQATALAVQSQAKGGLNLATGHLPGNRPITASHLKIADSFRSVGGSRPIFASQMKVAGTLVASGTRPISASTLVLSETYKLMGNRPIASNEIDEDSVDLMGYLD